jgi:uncharacterized membrane protein YuzA (DUF378 family)
MDINTMGIRRVRKMLVILGAVFSGSLGITVMGALPFATEANADIVAN